MRGQKCPKIGTLTLYLSSKKPSTDQICLLVAPAREYNDKMRKSFITVYSPRYSSYCLYAVSRHEVPQNPRLIFLSADSIVMTLFFEHTQHLFSSGFIWGNNKSDINFLAISLIFARRVQAAVSFCSRAIIGETPRLNPATTLLLMLLPMRQGQ